MKNNSIVSGNSSEVFHKFYLIAEFKARGFESAIKYKSESEIDFLCAIQNLDLKKLLNDLSEHLYSL